MRSSSPVIARPVVAAPAFAVALAGSIRAGFISENLAYNANSGLNLGATGQSVTTPAGEQWDNIQFNFYLAGAFPDRSGIWSFVAWRRRV